MHNDNYVRIHHLTKEWHSHACQGLTSMQFAKGPLQLWRSVWANIFVYLPRFVLFVMHAYDMCTMAFVIGNLCKGNRVYFISNCAI